MGRTQLGTPIAQQLDRLEKERERLLRLDDRDVVFEIPDNIDKITPADRVAEIEAVVKNMSMDRVRSMLDFILETIAAAREGGYGRVEGQALPFWIRLRNRREPATTRLVCSQCEHVQEAVDAAKNHTEHPEGQSFGQCVNCRNRHFLILGTAK